MNSRVPGGPSPAPTSKARKQWWSTFSPKEQRPCFAVEGQRTESGGRGSCCEQQFRPGIYPLIGPDMLFLYNQHSILIFFAYQLQQLQPHLLPVIVNIPNPSKACGPFFQQPSYNQPSWVSSGAHQEPAQPDGDQLGEHESGSGTSEHLGSRNWWENWPERPRPYVPVAFVWGSKHVKPTHWLDHQIGWSKNKLMKLPRISSASVLLGVMVLSNNIKDHQPNKYELSNSGKGFDITNKV